MSSYIINSNISEKQIEVEIASYFGWISNSTPFRLLDINEKITGADKKFFDSGFAFFMQFKKSEGLKSITDVPVSKRKNRSKKEDIRLFRTQRGLIDDPTLYFGLRKKSKNAIDYQHNILMKLSNTGYSLSFYVAPLHLDSQSYHNSLFSSATRYLLHPYYYIRKQGIFINNWISWVGHIPILREHISIIPHQSVSSHNHYYSYSKSGSDVAWHSPDLISESSIRLSDILSENIGKVIHENSLVEFDQIERLIEDEVGVSKLNNNFHPIEKIQKKARFLHRKYGIRLILLLGNKEYVKYLNANT